MCIVPARQVGAAPLFESELTASFQILSSSQVNLSPVAVQSRYDSSLHNNPEEDGADDFVRKLFDVILKHSVLCSR
jgi:hypothetical protein